MRCWMALQSAFLITWRASSVTSRVMVRLRRLFGLIANVFRRVGAAATTLRAYRQCIPFVVRGCRWEYFGDVTRGSFEDWRERTTGRPRWRGVPPLAGGGRGGVGDRGDSTAFCERESQNAGPRRTGNNKGYGCNEIPGRRLSASIVTASSVTFALF